MLYYLTSKAITALSILVLIKEIRSTTYQEKFNSIPVAKLSVNTKQAKIIDNLINRKVNPCDDFFAYACSNWTTYHNHTRRYTEASGFIDHKINKKLATFLDSYKPKKFKKQNDNTEQAIFDDTFQKVRAYYRSCKRRQDFKVMEYLKLVQPVDGKSMAELQKMSYKLPWDFDWLLVMAKLRRYGFKGVILEHNVLPTLENNDKYTIELDRANADMKLPSRSQALTYFKILGLNRTEAAIKYRAIKYFELKLIDLLKIEDPYGTLEFTIEELEEDLLFVDWRQYFNIILQRKLKKDFSIQLRNWEYFTRVIELLVETENEVICNYIVVMFMKYIIEDGTSYFEKIDCIVDLRSKMDFAINYIYRERFYSKHGATNERDSLTLLEALKHEFLKLLQENYLNLRQKELEFVKKKLKNLSINFGNLPPTKEKRTAFIKEYYIDIQLDAENYYKNHLTLLALRCEHEHWQLYQPAIGEDFVFISESSTTHSSSPYYLLRRNLIVIPYGIFQMPIYHKNMNSVLKHSIFGFLLAHELVHAFDESGLNFDHIGNYQNDSDIFMDNRKFTESLECLQQHQRTDSIDERIADFVGLKLAYNAYFDGADKIDPMREVGFTNLTMRRLFFLNLAQFFCGSMKAKFLEHDSDNVRLRQMVMHFPTFAEEFQCQVGDKMHPVEKCRIW